MQRNAEKLMQRNAKIKEKAVCLGSPKNRCQYVATKNQFDTSTGKNASQNLK